MKFFRNPRWQLIASMVVFGTIGLCVRAVDLPAAEIALYRSIAATLLIGLFLILTKKAIRFSEIKKSLPLLLLSGAAMGFNWIFLFEAYEYTTVSVATLSYYFAPVLVTVLCPLLFHEKMGMRQWICFVMSTLGLVLITVSADGTAGTNPLLGILLGLCAACLYATVILVNKAIRGIDGIQRTFLQFVAAVIVLIPYVLFTGGFHLTSLDGKGLGFLILIGVVHTGLTYCMYFSSLGELPGQQVAILSYIDPLVAVLCSILILREPLTPLQAIGGLLILGFTLWNELAPKKK